MTPELQDLVREAKRLESLSMSVYVAFAQRFATDDKLHKFWMSMARHEAAHVGALELLEAMISAAGVEPDVSHSRDAVLAAAATIERLATEAARETNLTRAFAIAVELESTELEELVLDLIHGLTDREQRRQATQMLVHDLSDLSLMIEKYTQDDELLAAADALVQKHVGD